MIDIAITAIGAHARSFVDTYNDELLIAIVRGEYPTEFAEFSPRRKELYERAALIVLDARANDHPKTVKGWSRKVLEKRIENLRNTIKRHSSTIGDDTTRRRRELASGTKLESNWQLIPISFRRFS